MVSETVPQTNVLPTYLAKDLTDGGDLARIVLDEQTYTLRITRAGKLILTK
ncbi:MAG: hemin uptake protein HemP [Ascidiaceihabitans sp.]|nr:hemin uptake protein HemP [Ascidiaceihabitans sp.]